MRPIPPFCDCGAPATRLKSGQAVCARCDAMERGARQNPVEVFVRRTTSVEPEPDKIIELQPHQPGPMGIVIVGRHRVYCF